MTALEVTGLTVAFGGRVALRDVSVSIAPGEAVGVIGPNGAGKTTLIDAVTGFVPYRGTVLVGGESIDRLAPHQRAARGIARTFQSTEVFDDLSIRENGAVSPESTRESVEAALAATGLVGDADRLAGSVPRTTRRLVGLARALASSPRVLLLDEIAAGLDAPARSFLARRLDDLLSSGIALLVVDHDLAFVSEVCRRVLAIDAGEVIALREPTHVRRDERVVDTASRTRRERHRSLAGSAAEVVDVTVGRDDVRVQDVTLLVQVGEIVAVLGANGAGKSTLLRAISGTTRVDAGLIALGGIDVTKRPIHARARLGLATVIEERPVFQTLTVGENLRVAGARRRGLPEWTSSWFPDLVPMLDRRAGLLSGGEQALVALARATVTCPRVLLVDEISAGLAPAYLGTVVAALRRAATELATAVVLAESQPYVLDFADRVCVLGHGRLTFEGPVADLVARPDLLETAHLGERG